MFSIILMFSFNFDSFYIIHKLASKEDLKFSKLLATSTGILAKGMNTFEFHRLQQRHKG